MVLHQDDDLQPFYSKVGTTAEGNLCSLPSKAIAPSSRTGIFTGIHILSNVVFKYLREEPSGINEVLYPRLMEELPTRIFGEYDTGAYWYDTGERTTLWTACLRLLQKLLGGHKTINEFMTHFADYERIDQGIWMPRGESLPEDCVLMPPLIIGRNCRVGKGAMLGPNAIIGDDCEIGEGAQVSSFIALGAAQIPGNRVSEDALQFGQLTLPAKKAL
jgi:NDP-sugar pyrophosphorylase family protein